jgi:hypothetical protein
MSYICLIANANGVALSGDSRLTMEPRFLHLHFDHTRKVFSDPGQNMAWACCGLTMYLPSNGTPLLDKFYRKEAWNDATGLVQ